MREPWHSGREIWGECVSGEEWLTESEAVGSGASVCVVNERERVNEWRETKRKEVIGDVLLSYFECVCVCVLRLNKIHSHLPVSLSTLPKTSLHNHSKTASSESHHLPQGEKFKLSLGTLHCKVYCQSINASINCFCERFPLLVRMCSYFQLLRHKRYQGLRWCAHEVGHNWRVPRKKSAKRHGGQK